MTFSMPILRGVGLLLLLVAPFAWARVSDHDLQNQYGNKILTLRQPHAGEHLHFDATGRLATPAATGAWTTDGQMRVEDISWHDGAIRIHGQRLFLFMDQKSHQLRDLSTVTKGDPARELFRARKPSEWAAKAGRVEIDVDPGVSGPEMPDVEKAMTAVFLASNEPLVNAVPDYWKRVVEAMAESKKSSGESKTAGSGPKRVSAPRARYAPDPGYSEVARKTGYEGTVVLWLVVGADGLPHDIRIARALGLGLDENAVETVRTWKFDPSKREGKRVPVPINVELTFRLY